MEGHERADDATLLGAWRAGDVRAADVLFARHFDAVYDFFARKVNGDVGDLVQRTFLGCIEARDRFAGASSFRTFLFAIARHELFHHYRRRRRDASIDFGISSLRALEPGPSSVVARRAEHAALLDALRGLPLDLQLLLELRYWEGFSGPDLAVALEAPEGTVRTRLRRALAALRAELAVVRGPLAVPEADASDEALDAWARALRDAFPSLGEG